MNDTTGKQGDPADLLSMMLQAPQQMLAQFIPQGAADDGDGDLAHWTSVAQRLHGMWLDFQREQLASAAGKLPGCSD